MYILNLFGDVLYYMRLLSLLPDLIHDNVNNLIKKIK